MYVCKYEVCKYEARSMCVSVAVCGRFLESVSSDLFELDISVSRPEERSPASFWPISHIRIGAGGTSGSHTRHLVLWLPGYCRWPLALRG